MFWKLSERKLEAESLVGAIVCCTAVKESADDAVPVDVPDTKSTRPEDPTVLFPRDKRTPVISPAVVFAGAEFDPTRRYPAVVALPVRV